MKGEPRWLSKAAVLAMHERLLAEHGGPPGILDEGRLDAALASPKNHYLYDRADIFRLAASYAYALTRNHAFHDGNKRVALTTAGVFLELNGFRLDATERDAAAAILALSAREFDEVGFAAWLKDSCSRIPRRQSARSRSSESSRASPRIPKRRRRPSRR